MKTVKQSARREAITFDGTPYYLEEKGSGVFCAFKQFIPGSGRRLHRYEIDERLGELVLGEDIREIPSRGVSLLVECDKKSALESSIVALRDFARVAWYDYVAAEAFGGKYASRRIAIVGDFGYYEVRPRVFRKISK